MIKAFLGLYQTRMNYSLPKLSAFSLILMLLSCNTPKPMGNDDFRPYNIIPKPLTLDTKEGNFILSSGQSLYVGEGKGMELASTFLIDYLERNTISLSLSDKELTDNGISLLLDPSLDGEESYQLDIKRNRDHNKRRKCCGSILWNSNP